VEAVSNVLREHTIPIFCREVVRTDERQFIYEKENRSQTECRTGTVFSGVGEARNEVPGRGEQKVLIRVIIFVI
jgi:hypothetical protein